MLRYKTINKTEAQLRNYACYTNNDEPRQIGRTKARIVEVLTKETARIMKTQEEKVRILIYEVSKENWGNSGVLGTDM